MSTSNDSIRENVVSVRERVAQAAQRSGRAAAAVRLVAVTKKVEAARVLEALSAGACELGENYVQEAREKIPEVNAATTLSKTPIWHLIGQLQSNKAKYAVKLFSVIQSVDNYQLAQEIEKQAAKHERTARCSILIEVQLGASEGRGGVAANAVLPLAEQISSLPHLHLQGLMGIAPYGLVEAETRRYFEQLRLLWEALPTENRQTLSMGMSGDFETAIEEGATLVRIGTALFGARKASTGI